MDKYSFLNTAHIGQFAHMYDEYLQRPDTLEPSWRAFFQGFDFGIENSNGSKLVENESVVPEKLQKEFKVVQLIDGYRKRGHLFTKTNPVRERRKYQPTLDIENFGLENSDLEDIFSAGEVIGIGPSTLSKIISYLENIYCDAIGVEFMYIRKPEKVEWIKNRLHINQNHPNFSEGDKKHILNKLNEAVTFENFLHTKYVGQKRFSLEGGESLIPALDTLVESAADKGVEEFVMGMAHRGRLNTLINIFGKSAKDVFSEFDGKDYEEEMVFDGDVKYHHGWTVNRTSNSGNRINLNLAPNPSHLETVGAIVEGISRAKLDNHFNGDTNKVLPIIVHGDAAIAGQGLPYEIVQMSNLKGYSTGGTIHIVINNQIGFTTNYLDARSSTYCTDVAKVTLSPVLHVNSDDVEAVVHATKFALDYRMEYSGDVFIDLLGYRKYGHNEGDEPRFTQPKLYKTIAKHKNPKDIYANQLIKEGIINLNFVKEIENSYRNSLESDLEESRKYTKTFVAPFMNKYWEKFNISGEIDLDKIIETKVSIEELTKVAKSITSLPKNKNFLRKIQRLINERKLMFFEKGELDWAMGEMLAYGTLLNEGYNVRLSGQDVQRGTFSHRHAITKSEDSEEEINLLNNLDNDKQGFLSIFNSLLSEYAVLGFDYGYSMASPNTLTIWEAQFGDFSNGAQIIIDQYISSAEDKWKLQNGIVMLLPHGYEGQGPEHSSARIERFLQLCGDDNMILANCTLPSNFFHLLRRQIHAEYRKPLIVFTPKSLLRNTDAVSKIKDFTEGNFEALIPDKLVLPKDAKVLVFCSGKFYYDLLKARDLKERMDVAIVRIEQIFPLPTEKILNQLKAYKDVKNIIWAQEEPINMGVWSYLLLNFKPARDFTVVARPVSSSPASGSSARSAKRHKKVIDKVFNKIKKP
tara:strand:- start:682 stop:3435 length:2754 start_codon:yes stop_codon:yes gene_type:complete